MVMRAPSVRETQTQGARTELTIVDTDIHAAIEEDTLRRFLSPYWRSHYDNFGRIGYTGSLMPRAMPNAVGMMPGPLMAPYRDPILNSCSPSCWMSGA